MFKTLLLPVDVSVGGEARKLLAAGKTLADQWNSVLHVVTVIPDAGMPIVSSFMEAGYEAGAMKQATAELENLVAEAGATAQLHVQVGTIYDQVIALADKLDADLILIGAHQPALSSYLLGSNAARLVRHSARSVLVLRGLED